MTAIERHLGEPPMGNYHSTGIQVVEGLISTDVVNLLSNYLSLMGHNHRMAVESRQVPDSHVLYGDPLFDSLMGTLAPRISEIVGCRLVPTYSYVRVYLQGQDLRPHRDRPACEHSLTVHLDAAASSDWPVEFEDVQRGRQSLWLRSGDAAVYRGREVRHWRDPCPVEWYMQAFMHYVDVDGPCRSEALDRRDSLGLPAVERNVAQ